MLVVVRLAWVRAGGHRVRVAQGGIGPRQGLELDVRRHLLGGVRLVVMVLVVVVMRGVRVSMKAGRGGARGGRVAAARRARRGTTVGCV
jgi:hypothetical protein